MSRPSPSLPLGAALLALTGAACSFPSTDPATDGIPLTLENIFRGGGGAGRAVLSPDGEMIAVSGPAPDGGGSGIHLMRAGGGGRRSLHLLAARRLAGLVPRWGADRVPRRGCAPRRRARRDEPGDRRRGGGPARALVVAGRRDARLLLHRVGLPGHLARRRERRVAAPAADDRSGRGRRRPLQPRVVAGRPLDRLHLQPGRLVARRRVAHRHGNPGGAPDLDLAHGLVESGCGPRTGRASSSWGRRRTSTGTRISPISTGSTSISRGRPRERYARRRSRCRCTRPTRSCASIRSGRETESGSTSRTSSAGRSSCGRFRPPAAWPPA